MSHTYSLDKFCSDIIENHPFDEIEIGDNASISRTVTVEDLRMFAAATGDANPNMLDPEFADSSIYREVIAHGMWSGAMLVNLLGSELPGLGTILVDQNLRYLRPIMVGDTVTFKITVERKYERTKHILFDAEVILESGQRAVTGTLEVLAPPNKISRKKLCVPKATLSTHTERFQAFVATAEGMDPVSTAVIHPCDEESLKG
ncbi:MAG: MaoC/PaaZ C-terminal domain-containing protein, partial [Fluviibacter sp.]